MGPGDVAFFDSGTTVAQVAAHIPSPLRRVNALTVVTHSLPVIDEIGGWESPHLVCLGGLYLPDYQALVGPQTVAALRELSADIVFLGCDGLTVEAGLTTPHMLVAEVGATMASRSRRVVAVADSSEARSPGLHPDRAACRRPGAHHRRRRGTGRDRASASPRDRGDPGLTLRDRRPCSTGPIQVSRG